MMDEKLRRDLLKIAPKILLLSFDHNEEVRETMKELWNSLVEIQKETAIIDERWDEIYAQCVEGLNSKEYRKKQAACLALTDLMPLRTWP